MKKIILDFDDFYDEADILPDLRNLKEVLPNLKVNLFTIFGKISPELLKEAQGIDWIQLIPHGWNHDTNYEFAYIDYDNMAEALKDYARFTPVKGFKAPGWQISEEALEALKDNGWWIATQYSDGRYNGNPDGPFQPPVPAGAKYYALKEETEYLTIHGHTWEVCGNGIKALWERLIKLPPICEFEFIDDIIDDGHHVKIDKRSSFY